MIPHRLSGIAGFAVIFALIAAGLYWHYTKTLWFFAAWLCVGIVLMPLVGSFLRWRRGTFDDPDDPSGV